MFWITGIGRSGTLWLAETLNQADGWTVKHEKAEPKALRRSTAWRPFPVERFRRGGEQYGECHGVLRYSLTPHFAGREREIPKRAILLRDPQAIIASWMNRSQHEQHDLSWIIKTVLVEIGHLLDYAATDPNCRIVSLGELLSVSSLQKFADWLGIEIRITADMLRPKNATAAADKWFRWNRQSRHLYDRLAERFLRPN